MATEFSLNLLGEFVVYRDMEQLALPPSCRRLVALAALKPKPLNRNWVCEALWPGSLPDRAVASLRSALWRLRPMGADALLTVRRQDISLAPHVWVDWREVTRLADLRATRGGVAEPALKALLHNGELLEGWTDSWCTAERERLRDLRHDVLSSATAPDRRQLPQHGFSPHVLHRVTDLRAP
ncbi:transcriptional regulator [Mycolicibacterium goodii]|uniref:AfsR/SARP family transcriptional regulator n=1 Tax=Mycolicibacterium goodii TaxID=134601 RepID=UPI001BDCC445|nr:transcriptional regulator [Mycolicibacterium goodii]MBU8810518.1 transcriptional regulator [Mycolicibacterium goodii]ULN45975.1 transcriptional regulator [Mycolicibacterium goodii]